jgi:hypothetical protein
MSVSDVQRESAPPPRIAKTQARWFFCPQSLWSNPWGRGAVLALLATALLLPIWTVQYPPIVDYPNHLASAFVLAHLNDPAYGFGGFYSADWNTNPYLAMDVILIALQRVVNIDIAGRLLLSLCVLAIPAATWFFLRKANPEGAGLTLWSLLIAHNLYFFQWGMINQQLGLALCLVLIGAWLQFLSRPRLTTWCLLLLLTVALFFTHFLAFAIAGFAMTAYAAITRQKILEFARLWVLFLPGAMMFRHAAASHAGSGWGVVYSLQAKVLGVLVASTTGISTAADFLFLLLLFAGVAVACVDNAELTWNRRWLGVAGCLFLLYWALPGNFGPGMNADRRLMPFLFVLVLAGVRVGARRVAVLAVFAVALFMARAGFVEYSFVRAQQVANRLSQSFAVIPNGSRVLAVGPGSERLQHFWAYGVIQRGWLSPCLFQNPGVQPLRTKSQSDNACAERGETTPLNWEQVQKDFDYAWLYKTAETSSAGTVVYSDGELRVVRLK